jgi:glycosyltransferase involved in cell wall biosynthesis
VPEVVDHEVTGFICDDLDEFTAAISRVKEIDPRACRRAVEERVTVKRMIDGYEDVFRQVLAKKGDRSAGCDRRDAPEYTARPGSLDV